MKYYLYRHIRLDKNEPFYIGRGTKSNRNYTTIKSVYSRAYCKMLAGKQENKTSLIYA